MSNAWTGLDLRRRVFVVLATAAMFGAVLLLARTATSPRMALLYAGLEPTAAGEVVNALEAAGAAFEIRGNAIFVDAMRRDALRMTLASDGLPSNGGQGYELLDTLTGFGTTSQMFDAAYWRAKEGELARTIMTNRQISAARVHLSNPSSDPFARGRVASASVSVTVNSGGLTGPQAMAIRHLVAAAVSGLVPKEVAVIDSLNGLVPLDAANGANASGVANARAETLKLNVTRLLEARVGAGRAIVEVNVDTVTERETIFERRLDPDSRIAISSDTEETTTRANDARGGAVTVASNLPDGDGAGSGRSSESNESRSREVVNYEISETKREILREPGAVRRISVAIMVDGIETVTDAGEGTWAPRDTGELDSMRDLVASAIGYDEARGDTITIRSMQFQPFPAPSAPLPVGLLDRLAFDAMALVQLAVLAVVSLILGLFVVRPLLAGVRSAPVVAQLPAPLPELDGGIAALPALDGEFATMAPPMGGIGFPSETLAIANAQEEPAERLRRLIEDRKEETVEVLAQWMQDQPEQVR